MKVINIGPRLHLHFSFLLLKGITGKLIQNTVNKDTLFVCFYSIELAYGEVMCPMGK